MKKPIAFDELWSLVSELILEEGKQVLSVSVSVNSPAGSGGYSVYEWKKLWWVLDPIGDWHGPFDPWDEEVLDSDVTKISTDGVWELNGKSATRLLPYLTLINLNEGMERSALDDDDEEEEEPFAVLVNGTPYAPVKGPDGMEWKRVRAR